MYVLHLAKPIVIAHRVMAVRVASVAHIHFRRTVVVKQVVRLVVLARQPLEVEDVVLYKHVHLLVTASKVKIAEMGSVCV